MFQCLLELQFLEMMMAMIIKVDIHSRFHRYSVFAVDNHVWPYWFGYACMNLTRHAADTTIVYPQPIRSRRAICRSMSSLRLVSTLSTTTTDDGGTQDKKKKISYTKPIQVAEYSKLKDGSIHYDKRSLVCKAIRPQ